MKFAPKWVFDSSFLKVPVIHCILLTNILCQSFNGRIAKTRLSNNPELLRARVSEMESEELIRRCRAIKLSDEEGGRVSFKSKMKDKGEKIVAGCLIGKVINTRGVSIEGLKMAMQRVWKTTREVKIESLGDNIFIFKFGSEADKRSILVGGPWHFDRALIVLIEPVGIGDVKKQDFSHTSF